MTVQEIKFLFNKLSESINSTEKLTLEVPTSFPTISTQNSAKFTSNKNADLCYNFQLCKLIMHHFE
jgi:hypothetical protein